MLQLICNGGSRGFVPVVAEHQSLSPLCVAGPKVSNFAQTRTHDRPKVLSYVVIG